MKKSIYIQPVLYVIECDEEKLLAGSPSLRATIISAPGDITQSYSDPDVQSGTTDIGTNGFSKQAWDCWADDNEDDLY